MSKTFIIGAPVILILAIISFVTTKSYTFNIHLNKIFRIPILIIAILTFSTLIVFIADAKGLNIRWYVNLLYNPITSTETRYDTRYGNLNRTYAIAKDNIFIGLGLASQESEFTGDSMYISLFHNTGLLGILIYACIFVIGLKKFITVFDIPGVLVVIALLLAGISTSLFTSSIGAMIIGYMASFDLGRKYCVFNI